jgi:Alpha/beta hydrolase domain
MTSALRIEGPVTGGRWGRPFGATLVDLAAEGYVEEEWFFEGSAPRYRPVGSLGDDGRWSVEPAGSAPFRTRAVVRRPADADRFNGTVIVEWNNVSAGNDIFEAGDTPVIFDEGFAYVGVSAQHVGVHGLSANPQGLVAWDPERYGSLHVDDDTLSYGIFAEIARAFAPGQERPPVDPLSGLVVQKVVGAGGSQSGARLATYINALHLRDPIFDAFVLFTWFGNGSSLDDPTVLDLNAGPAGRPPSLPTRIRDDVGVPVMVVNSEGEALSCHAVAQLDTVGFRHWEVAGAPHGPRLNMTPILAKMQRDGVQGPGALVGLDVLSPVPWAPVLDAGLVHLQRWLHGGPPPPVQPRIKVAPDGGRIERDADGNAIGGVRLPEMEAALVTSIGAIEEAGMGGLLGRWTPLPDDVIRSRYPDREAYLAAYRRAAEAAVEAGVLRQRDAEAGLARADAAYR